MSVFYLSIKTSSLILLSKKESTRTPSTAYNYFPPIDIPDLELPKPSKLKEY